MWVSRECLRDCHAMSDLWYLIVNAIHTHTYTTTMRSRIQLENWFSPNRASSTVYESTIIEALPFSCTVQHLLHSREIRACVSIVTTLGLLLTWLDVLSNRFYESL